MDFVFFSRLIRIFANLRELKYFIYDFRQPEPMSFNLKILSAFCAVSMIAVSQAAYARTIEVRPGEIASGKASLEVPAGETLSIKGSLDASDLFMLGKSRLLKNLDLREAIIETYKGESLQGRFSYQAASIPSGAFAGSPIETIVLPEGLMHIGDAAFASSSLKSVILPENVDSVGFGAFAYCPALREVTAANGKIGESAFEGCASLETFVSGEGLRVIARRAFAGTGLNRLDLSACANLKTIGDETLAGCKALESVSLCPRATYTLGKGVFFNCVALKSISGLHAGVLPPLTFANNRRLTSQQAILDCAAGPIGAYAMANNSSMPASITLPETLQVLGDRSMAGCIFLKEINVEALASAPATGEKVWDGINQSEVKLITSSQNNSLFSKAPQWQDFSIVTSGHPATDSGTDSISASITNGVLDILNLSERSAIALYSADGREVFKGLSHNAGHFSARVNAPPGGIFILSVTSVQGVSHIVKLPAR